MGKILKKLTTQETGTGGLSEKTEEARSPHNFWKACMRLPPLTAYRITGAGIMIF